MLNEMAETVGTEFDFRSSQSSKLEQQRLWALITSRLLTFPAPPNGNANTLKAIEARDSRCASFMTGFSSLPISEDPAGNSNAQWAGVSKILGPRWSQLPALTVGLIGVQVVWSVEMSYGERLLNPFSCVRSASTFPIPHPYVSSTHSSDTWPLLRLTLDAETVSCLTSFNSTAVHPFIGIIKVIDVNGPVSWPFVRSHCSTTYRYDHTDYLFGKHSDHSRCHYRQQQIQVRPPKTVHDRIDILLHRVSTPLGHPPA